MNYEPESHEPFVSNLHAHLTLENTENKFRFKIFLDT